MNAKTESSIIELAKKIIESYKDKLDKKEINIENPTITRSQNNGKYSSELTINVKDDSGIFDVLEFFIYKDDNLTADLDEYETHIKDFIKEILDEINESE